MLYFFPKYSASDKITVSPNFSIEVKSLSPEIRWVARPSWANERRKLSFGSLHLLTSNSTSINSAFFSIWCKRLIKSSSGKYFLNFGCLATSMNSSYNSVLNNKTIEPSLSILSSFENLPVKMKLIQRFVSIITLFFLCSISLSSNNFYFLGNVFQSWRIWRGFFS